MYWIATDHIKAVHGFSMRHGGVSPAPFASLNLGGSDDLPENIAQNRQRALSELHIEYGQVSYLNQVHGNEVCIASPGKQTGDALVTNQKNVAIAVGAADCYPLLFHDEVNGVIGAAHCGWKGTLAKIAANTMDEMLRLGADVHHIKVAIGQGICKQNYEVSEEVISHFRGKGFPEKCWEGRHLDLLEANRFVLQQAGISKTNIWSMNRCTTEPDFFSYRRDGGKTGRMWAIIMLR